MAEPMVAQPQSLLLEPLGRFDTIDLDVLNDRLVAWGHRMGPLTRPPEYGCWCYGLWHNDLLVGVASTSSLIRETAAGLTRAEAVELSRLCAARRDLCRVVLRLWREFAFPGLCAARGCEWAVSYQDADLHDGQLYRMDGWVPLQWRPGGSIDPRSGRRGRRAVIWGWHRDAQTRRDRCDRALRAAIEMRASNQDHASGGSNIYG